MTFLEEFDEKISAGMGGLYIKSFEPEDVLGDLRRLTEEKYTEDSESKEKKLGMILAVWDVHRGLCVLDPRHGDEFRQMDNVPDLPAAISAMAILKAGADEDTKIILVLRNGHLQLANAVISQMIENQIMVGKKDHQHLVILAPRVVLPLELRKMFEAGIIEHELPKAAELKTILSNVAEAGELPKDPAPILEAAAGLTRIEFEDAVALSIVRHSEVRPDVIFSIKAQGLKSGNQAVQLYTGDESFDDIGGLTFLREFAKSSLSKKWDNPKFRPRGVFMVGPPGIGKSLFAKALGNEVGRPTLCVDLGAARGGVQGETEHNIREGLAKIDAMAPCVAFIDELEKALSGDSSGRTDGGTGARLKGTLLTWMNDHKSDVYLVATCNDVSSLMEENPEFARAGRFDGMFYLDLPNRRAKDQIWEIHMVNYELEDQELPDDEDWTGAEIEGCCRLAKLRSKSLAKIGKSMPKIADQAADSIGATRAWADGKCYSAEYDDIYRIRKHASKLEALHVGNGAPRRTVIRKKRKSV